MNVEAKCQAKEGFDLKSLGKANYCFCIVTDVDNDNNGKFDRLVCEDTFLPNKGYKFGDVDEATAKARVNRTVSTNITLSSASDVVVAYVDSKQ